MKKILICSAIAAAVMIAPASTWMADLGLGTTPAYAKAKKAAKTPKACGYPSMRDESAFNRCSSAGWK